VKSVRLAKLSKIPRNSVITPHLELKRGDGPGAGNAPSNKRVVLDSRARGAGSVAETGEAGRMNVDLAGVGGGGGGLRGVGWGVRGGVVECGVCGSK